MFALASATISAVRPVISKRVPAAVRPPPPPRIITRPATILGYGITYRKGEFRMYGPGAATGMYSLSGGNAARMEPSHIRNEIINDSIPKHHIMVSILDNVLELNGNDKKPVSLFKQKHAHGEPVRDPSAPVPPSLKARAARAGNPCATPCDDRRTNRPERNRNKQKSGGFHENVCDFTLCFGARDRHPVRRSLCLRPGRCRFPRRCRGELCFERQFRESQGNVLQVPGQ